ncbi:Membrane protein involved in the export of O-antigen teichoic acid lipoteichoic acid [Geobacillus stearothermophilus]|uniref:oligosaccharide flippase family protein n=1 Tax=Geobacillus stearothermophilus TaxID=1422 RepID=UPI0007DA4530|nr:oligosaccharide flippase family protein [Geobacillus stearothermophilus]OAO78694.1 Membrane protein involved in the export of O-antigen teichoic acid lipoteichoic acid [Geobacillus stearothermophilus]
MQTSRISNILWVAISNLVLLLANFGVSVLLANHLGANAFGTFMFAYTIFNYLIILNNYGLKKYVITNLSSNQKAFHELYSSSLLIKLLLSIITGIILLFLLLNLDMEIPKKVSIIIFFIASFFLAFDLQAFYDSYEKSKVDSFLLILRNLLYFGVTLFLVLVNKANVISVSLVFLATTFLYVLLQYGFIKRYLSSIKLVFRKENIKTVLFGAFPLFWAEVMVNIYDKADIIMLSTMKGDKEVGIYSVATRLVAAIILVVGAAYRVLLPSLSKVDNLEKRNMYISNAVKYLGIITIPITIGGIATSSQLIDFFFNDEYQGSVIALQILLLNVTIVGIGAIFGTVLLAIGEVRYYTFAITCGAVINIIGNFLLIPRYSFIGASITTVLAQLIVSGVSFFIYKRKYNPEFKFNLTKVVFISTLMGGMAFLLGNKISVIFNIIFCMILYILLVIISNVVDRKNFVHGFK